jgi:hypothetical protein
MRFGVEMKKYNYSVGAITNVISSMVIKSQIFSDGTAYWQAGIQFPSNALAVTT